MAYYLGIKEKSILTWNKPQGILLSQWKVETRNGITNRKKYHSRCLYASMKKKIHKRLIMIMLLVRTSWNVKLQRRRSHIMYILHFIIHAYSKINYTHIYMHVHVHIQVHIYTHLHVHMPQTSKNQVTSGSQSYVALDFCSHTHIYNIKLLLGVFRSEWGTVFRILDYGTVWTSVQWLFSDQSVREAVSERPSRNWKRREG